MRTGSTTTAPTGPNMTGSTSAATTTPRSTTPGRRENIEQRRRDSLDWLERAGPFNPPEPRQPDGPDSGDFTPDHDKT